MEVNSSELKEMMKAVFENFRTMETQILAYEFAIHLLTTGGFINAAAPWKVTLEAARQHPAMAKKMDDKYNPLIADVLQAIDRTEPGEAFAELLRKWKPSGPIN